MKAEQSGGSARCRVCESGQDESISHVVSSCQGMSVERAKMLSELKILLTKTKNNITFDEISNGEEQLCQFLLDPTSLNLPKRVSLYDPLLPEVMRFSRDFCFLIDKTRIRLLKELENNK